MKNRYYIIFLLFFLMHPVSVQATAMAPDIIYINGEKWDLLERPIKADPALHAKLNEFLPKSHRVINTANFDGYTGYWILKENQLYLQKIEVEMVNEKTGEIYMLEAGDVAAYKAKYTNATGHMGIVAYHNDRFQLVYAGTSDKKIYIAATPMTWWKKNYDNIVVRIYVGINK